MWESISSLLNVLLGSGLIVTLATISSTRKKAQTESKQAEMDLAKEYVQEYSKNIVEPLRENIEKQIGTLNDEITGLKKELARFRKAIEKGKACPYINACPIEHELQKAAECGEGKPNSKVARKDKD
jgi:hypothetical protein